MRNLIVEIAEKDFLKGKAIKQPMLLTITQSLSRKKIIIPYFLIECLIKSQIPKKIFKTIKSIKVFPL